MSITQTLGHNGRDDSDPQKLPEDAGDICHAAVSVTQIQQEGKGSSCRAHVNVQLE